MEEAVPAVPGTVSLEDVRIIHGEFYEEMLIG
jgi:hypothetical protein